ncbi:hypothetical protein [Legionella cincinnatiensis]|uniref:Uncharacterized protein n=1 Tax=Legionella cincinnatiensis TaxID=28085 RepID=A0A378IKU6_9GAMM|nr:hypothetical protein [Legionella cincinnatiensis]KTC83063.1 hypothetical protein Lcin_2435 [Legionella cincinnatiensis]STX35897.1 Uncharacterised protein [Legionella cincinnatiensis]
MPSNQLSLLCEQIEKQNTDHFGKFYMYVALLNTVTVRNKTFADSLPKYSRGLAFWRDNRLNIGEIPVEFSKQLNAYAREFINPQPHWSNTIYNIALAYIRKGKISDLTYIIDQMLDHLVAIQGHQSHNDNIYNHIHFEEKKEGLIAFIQQVSMLNQQLLSAVDSGCNTALSLLVVTTGAVLILASIFSLIPTVIGLGLVLGGAYGAYHFVEQATEQTKLLEKQMDQVVQKIKQLPRDESLFGDENYNAFYAAVIKPLPYAALTAAEQLMFEDSHKDKLTEQREMLDQVCTIFSY